MNYIDTKYINLVSVFLERFKPLGNNSYNFRCPFCGDSTKKKNKARGYIFDSENVPTFKCHNCGKVTNFNGFLKEFNHNLWEQWKIEKFGKPKKEEVSFATKRFNEWVIDSKSVLRGCQPLTETDPNDEAYQYAIYRKIPSNYFDDIYVCDDINIITMRLDKYKDKKFKKLKALVIPFFNKKDEFTHLQCRFIDNPDMRFITLEINEGNKLYGEKYVNWYKPVHVTEGPIDAMMTDNCLALAGASHHSSMSYIQEKISIDTGDYNPANIIMVMDNDYSYNKDIMKQLVAHINKGYSVIIYDKRFKWKDLNDASRLGGWSREMILEYLRERTFSGLRAKLELSNLNK